MRAGVPATTSRGYARHRPETTTLYQVVRENLATLYGAVDDGALRIALPDFVRGEFDGYLDCGVLCRGFARLRCETCDESRLVAFSCKGRGFCPSCLGRRMCATAADLVEHVLPEAPLRQWVLTFPFAWRKRLGYDAPLLGALTRAFVQTVLGFYKERLGAGQSGAVVVVQRTASDLKLNPHLHVVFLDGTFREDGDGAAFTALPHLSTREVAEVLARACRRIHKWLRRRGLLQDDGEQGPIEDGLAELAASAASGKAPPAGPEWRRRALPLVRGAPSFDKPLCASQDGFTLHAATRAGARSTQGREALLKYVLRPPVANERVTHGPDGLVRIALKKPFADGTVAIDMDPLSLLCRLAAAVPAPRVNMIRYAGVLAANAKLRPLVVRRATRAAATEDDEAPAADEERPRTRYWAWAELLKRTFAVDVLECDKCHGRLKLLAVVTEPKSVARFLKRMGEPTEPPRRLPARGPPYWKSRVLRRMAADVAVA
jgi:hypothetical protein